MPEDQAPKLKTVGRYQIIEELGRGAMAVVYKGKDPVIGRTVALKTLLFREDNKEMRDLRAALYRDACAAGTLAHPNIVTIYDVIEEAGMTAVAMEFIEGRTLDSIIKEKAPLPIDMALGLFDQIVAGLDYAHTKGIIHRDVKPANIMLTNDGRVKVTDFGVARVTSAGATMTATVVGSPSYMSPEQIRGGKLDGRSDMFSAATVFYEMLTKERPFPGDDIATTLYRIVHELPTPPAEFNPAIGPELTAVFERAMAKDPAERYATGAELAKAARQAAEAKGRTTGRVTAADIAATVKIGAVGAAVAAAPAPRAAAAPAAAPAAAKAERAAAVAPVPVEAPRRGMPIGLIAAGVAAVLVLGVGAYVFLGRSGTSSPPGGASSPPLSAQNNPATPLAATPAPSGPATTGQVAQQPAATTAIETPPPAPVVETPAPAPARQTNAAARRGGAANATATAPTTRPARGAQTSPAAPAQPTAATGAPAGGTTAPPPAATAPPTETPVTRAPPPAEPPPARPEPPAAAPPAAASINVQFEVLNDENTTGLQILLDGRAVSGLYPPTQRVTAGTHQVTYRWTQGSLLGQEFTRSIDIPSTATQGIRLRANPTTSSIQVIVRR